MRECLKLRHVTNQLSEIAKSLFSWVLSLGRWWKLWGNTRWRLGDPAISLTSRAYNWDLGLTRSGNRFIHSSALQIRKLCRSDLNQRQQICWPYHSSKEMEDFMRNWLGIVSALVMIFWSSTGTMSAAVSTVELMNARLQAGELGQLELELSQRLLAAPRDDQIRFALGATQFLRTVERFSQDMYRYGLEPDPELVQGIPFFRIPVPHNPNPEKISYRAFRLSLARAVNGFNRAAATLSGMGSAEVKLPLSLGQARIDMNGDGKAQDNERLFEVLNVVNQTPWQSAPPVTEEQAARFVIAFDRGDAAWLRGYCHLLNAILDFQLGYDFKVTFNDSYHLLFPRAQLPGGQVTLRQSRATESFMGQLSDAVVMVQELNWPVARPKRLRASLQHLREVVAMSRESWRFILAETDDEAEWIPSPKQVSGVLGTQITDATVEGWMGFLDHFDQILDGKLMIPHWRFEEGFNFARLLSEPRTFNLVQLIQGRSMLPYLQKGPTLSSGEWSRLEGLLGGSFLSFAAWVN